jgi:colanic acid biosynthesis glycosyl transferase WcaI
MRLLMVTNVFHPDRGGGGAIFSDLAYGLAGRGFDVTVRCAYPYYPEWRDKSGKNGCAVERYDEQGVHVERYGIYIPRRPNSLVQRLIYEASFMVSLLRSLPRGRHFDAVMVFCPLAGAVAFGVLNRWWWRKPMWLNVQDLSADAAAAAGIAKGRALIKSLGAVQHFLFNQAQVWSTISPVMVERLERIRHRGQPIHYLPNWLNQSMWDAIAAHPHGPLPEPGAPLRLLYAGNIGAKQDLLRFCKLLHESDAPFVFRVHGDGGGAPAIREWMEQVQDPRFTFGPFMEEPEFARKLSEADVFIITEKSGSGGSFIPCKTISGLAAGCAILAVCDADSPLGQEMREHQPGPWFSWDDAGKAPALLAALSRDPTPLAQWQQRAKQRAVFYERNRIIDAFAEKLLAL